ncbi:MAG: TonB-dependent receptor [Prevotella sp.]|nr:TonB-dependent receptor [Prevotella sp.]
MEYVGYRPLDVDVYDFEESVEIALADNSNKLEEVVVLGYQTLKRKSLTGAVSSVEGGDLESIAGASFTEKLQGQAPGMLVSNSSGTPGTSVFVRLRGTTSINAGNDPLYIVDGIPFNGNSIQSLDQGALVANPLADISPDDIKDVQVLKDASATAIYGARGANGVILITTKRGSKNKKTQVNVKAEIGWGKAAKLWDVLDGPNTAILLNEIAVNDGKAPTFDPNTANNYVLRDKAFRTAKQQSVGASITGGNDRTNFFIGIDYTDQEAILETQGFRRMGLRVNLDHDINKKLTLSSSNQLTFSRRTLSPTGDGPTSLLQTSVQHNPLVNPYKDDGSYNYSGTFENIYAILNNNDNKSYGLRNLNNLTLTWKITPELRFKSSWSYDNNQFRERRYYNSQLKNGSPNGNAREVNTNLYTLTAEQLLNFNKTFKKIHEIAAFIGNSVQYTERHAISVNGSDFPSDAFSEIGSAAVTEGSTSGSSSSLISWFGGFNYGLLDRYNLDFNIRADASSRFGSDNRWGYFPSFGASWLVSKENFLKGIKWLTTFRIKGSLGWTGNQSISDFASLGLWSGGGIYNNQSGVIQSQLANPDLKWETTRQFDLGFEASFFNDRLSIAFDYYNKYTYDLLLQAPISGKTGFSSIFKNIGEMSNKGIEFSITSRNIQKKDFNWTTRFNISHNGNKIEKLESPITQYNRDWVRLEEGKPMYSFWLYKELGIDPETGNAIYEDVDKDGKITTADRQICGDNWPDFNGSLINDFKYKNFDVAVNFYYTVGNDVFNMMRFFMEAGGTYGNKRALLTSQLDRWQKPGDHAKLPRLTSTTNPDGSLNYGFQTSRYLEDGSFLRLKNLSIGYTLPKKQLQSIGIEKARVYLNITNVFTITKYSGPDPESNVGTTYSAIQGLDFGLAPQPRQFIIGTNITF